MSSSKLELSLRSCSSPSSASSCSSTKTHHLSRLPITPPDRPEISQPQLGFRRRPSPIPRSAECLCPALEAIGKHCKHLKKLQRCMYGWEVLDKVSQDDEALAIAATMPKLNHLEILYLRISTEAVCQILLKCPEQQLLDV
ncbi:PREDICTED: F-box [Prunus dulcis]|uniref:PREDICTED: F-box n=1 Tax=Prunus dulcis TaxID=3755 RepID=A0A5E4FSA3_PRUDU|nr:PREDICTED: F-box [Prunus dulcis]